MVYMPSCVYIEGVPWWVCLPGVYTGCTTVGMPPWCIYRVYHGGVCLPVCVYLRVYRGGYTSLGVYLSVYMVGIPPWVYTSLRRVVPLFL